MSREAVYKELEDMFGLVPSFFKLVSDSTLRLGWELFKKVHLENGPVPNKYRELIGVAISTVTNCRYCLLYHMEIAKLNGATDAEIEDAVRYAKSSAGWSAYLNGLQIDYYQFRQEIHAACTHVRKNMEAA